jgi:hypothetical protein
MRKIVTSPTHSPLPYRHYDWCAYFDGEEEAGNYGYGATEIEAIADFLTEAVADERVSEAEALGLSAAHGLKPTCDEAGNWRYVPAAEIDGSRVPASAIAAVSLDQTLLATVASALDIPADPARVAVEGIQMDEAAA